MELPHLEPDYDGIHRKMVAETECKHSQTTIRKKSASDGAVSIWHQCHKCGTKIGPAIRKNTLTKEQIEVLPIWDGDIEKDFYRNREKHHHQMLGLERERVAQEWKRRYDAYLETPEWKRKRQLVFLRAQGICEGCRSAPATEVHHTTYADAGAEFLFQLVALCRPCHDRYHTPPQQPGGASAPQSRSGSEQLIT